MVAKTITTQKGIPQASVLARTSDGTVQITLTIPYGKVQQTREDVIREMIESLEIPGFRKGKAPTDLAMKHIDKQRVYEHTLQHLLPEIYADAVEEHKLRPVLAPRFELINVEEEKDWQIRAITCEVPNVELGEYKKEVQGAVKATDIWVPGKDSEPKKEPTQEEKEQQALLALLNTARVEIPALLIEEEVNHRLSQLLDQVQKLGLTVEQYLSSSGKTIEKVREEYSQQARDSIKLVLVLNKVAEEEKVEVTETEIDEIIKAGSNASAESVKQVEQLLQNQEQRRLVRSVLLRRKALDSLTHLI